MSPDELCPWQLYAALEGGAVHTAERDGRFFVIIDESALESILDEEDLEGLELTKIVEFETLQARTEYLKRRFS